MTNLERTLRNGLTIDNLIAELENMKEQHGGDKKVAFQYTANDYWKTEIAAVVTGVDLCNVSHSDYHQCLRVEEEELEEGLSTEIVTLTTDSAY